LKYRSETTRSGAGGAFVTDHGGANPWDYLPNGIFEALTR
jgi:hypothetical protein